MNGIIIKKLSWTQRHTNCIIKRLQADIFPAIGEKQIDKIKASELLDTLKLIEKRGALDVWH
ncbi:MAG: hypothetical protein EKK61_06285 [Rickettsiales bacterium]|nr:MAG: hypothetical protein EKK61_06285 [Rickettsiales bacterium]